MNTKHRAEGDHEDNQPTQKTLSVGLTEERNGLAQRLQGLNDFITSQDFQKVDHVERERLQGQQTAMAQYLDVLNHRIEYHAGREAQG